MAAAPLVGPWRAARLDDRRSHLLGALRRAADHAQDPSEGPRRDSVVALRGAGRARDRPECRTARGRGHVSEGAKDAGSLFATTPAANRSAPSPRPVRRSTSEPRVLAGITR